MLTAVHEARNSSEPEPPHTSGNSNGSGSSAGDAALQQLQQMHIAAQHQNGNCPAASSAAETSASALLADDGAAPPNSKPAQGHDAQTVPALQGSGSTQVHRTQGVAAQQDSGHAQGGFLADLLTSSYTRHAPGTGDMRHDTEGWRCLETSFKVCSPFNWRICRHPVRPPNLRSLTGYRICPAACKEESPAIHQVKSCQS